MEILYESPTKQPRIRISFESLYEKYKTEFIDNCEEILILKEQEFLNFFFSRMKLILKDYYGENIIESNPEFPIFMIQCEKN